MSDKLFGGFSTFVTVTQNYEDLRAAHSGDGVHKCGQKNRTKGNPAFRDWQYRLRRGERLPRGRFFRGKKAGRPSVLLDRMRITPQMAEGLKAVRAYDRRNTGTPQD